MTEQKYSINFITHGKEGFKPPGFRPELPDRFAHHLASLDSEVVPGAGFHIDFIWFRPGEQAGNEVIEETHSHSFDEVITFIGSNPEDIHDLGGEIELWIDGEQHIIDKSFMAFVPAGLSHGPLKMRKIDRPILHYTAGPEEKYE